MAHVRMSDEVIAILKKSTIEGNVLKLPPGQLERKLYESVNAALIAAGGRWKTNLKGHLFDGDPMSKLGLALETGTVIDEKKVRQAYYTPAALAARVVELAEVRDHHNVLEPSAGGGALLKALPPRCRQTAVELDEQAAMALNGLGLARVHCFNFLMWQTEERFDRIVMNPPFTRNQDIKHVSHALKFLKPGGILVAVMWPNTERAAFQNMLADHGGDYEVYDNPAGSFKESGTDVATITVKIRNPA